MGQDANDKAIPLLVLVYLIMCYGKLWAKKTLR